MTIEEAIEAIRTGLRGVVEPSDDINIDIEIWDRRKYRRGIEVEYRVYIPRHGDHTSDTLAGLVAGIVSKLGLTRAGGDPAEVDAALAGIG